MNVRLLCWACEKGMGCGCGGIVVCWTMSQVVFRDVCWRVNVSGMLTHVVFACATREYRGVRYKGLVLFRDFSRFTFVFWFRVCKARFS